MIAVSLGPGTKPPSQRAGSNQSPLVAERQAIVDNRLRSSSLSVQGRKNCDVNLGRRRRAEPLNFLSPQNQPEMDMCVLPWVVLCREIPKVREDLARKRQKFL